MESTEARPPGRPPKKAAEFRAEAVRLVEEGGQSLRQVARHAIVEWLEVFYNRQRRHSAPGDGSPVAFEP